MAASDAKSVPIKNQAYRVYIPMRYDDGEVVAGLAAFDTGLGSGAGKAIVLKDDGSPANSTNSISVGAGGYNWYLDLTAAEMNADAVTVVFKSTTTNVQEEWKVLYTEARGLRDLAFPNVSGRGIDVDASGGVEVGSLAADVITAASIAANAIGATEIADGAFTSAKFVDGFLTAAKIATNAIDADALAADALTEITAACEAAGVSIADDVWDEAMAEPASVPAVTATARQVLAWLLVLSRNKRQQTAGTETLRNDADSASIGTASKTDDGTTFVRHEWA